MKRIQLLLSLGLASALLLTACGGDDDDDNGDNGNGGNTPGATQTTTSGGTPSGGDATNTPSSGGNGNGNGGSELEDAIRNLAGKSFTASYEIVTTVEGSDQTGTITIVQDEPRFATVMQLTSGTIAIIENESGSFSCFGSGTFGTCNRGDQTLGSVFDLREVADDAGDLSSYNQIDDRTINGRDSRCWQGTDPESELETTFCVSKRDGLLTFSGAEGFEMSLVDFSDDIDEDLFELPYPVQ